VTDEPKRCEICQQPLVVWSSRKEFQPPATTQQVWQCPARHETWVRDTFTDEWRLIVRNPGPHDDSAA
jgi:hypothetical protein